MAIQQFSSLYCAGYYCLPTEPQTRRNCSHALPNKHVGAALPTFANPTLLVIFMSNQYIICGASRSGKSILARRLQEKFRGSWILGDAIVSSMEDAFPDFGISHHGDLQDIGNRFAEFIKFVLFHYGYAGCGYVLDTTHLYPRHIIGIREKIGNVPAVFLGYTRADPDEKLRRIRSFDPKNWWTSELSDAELKQLIHDQISKSIQLRESCAELGIPYVDVSRHFEESLDRAEAILNSAVT
jgi:hypothetical protein